MIKKNLYWIIAIAVVAGGMFFAGTKYENGRISSNPQSFFANADNRQAFQQGADNAANGFSKRTGNAGGNGMTAGEIIAKDDKSITVKTQDGGSKIVFYSESSEISKFAAGTSGDLGVGKTVFVSGKTNSDGSVTAQSIQLRPQQAPAQQ